MWCYRLSLLRGDRQHSPMGSHWLLRKLGVDPNLHSLESRNHSEIVTLKMELISYAEDTEDDFELWSQNNKSDVDRQLRARQVLHILASGTLRRLAKIWVFFPKFLPMTQSWSPKPLREWGSFNFHKQGTMNGVMVRRCPITCYQPS